MSRSNRLICCLCSTPLHRYLDPDPLLLESEANVATNPKFHSLNRAIVQLIDDFSMVNFMGLDSGSEDSVGALLSHIDHAMQYGEDEEPKEPKDMDRYEPDEDAGGGVDIDDEAQFEEMMRGGAGAVEI